MQTEFIQKNKKRLKRREKMLILGNKILFLMKILTFVSIMLLLAGLFSCQKAKKTRSANVTCNTYKIEPNTILNKYDTICVYTQVMQTTKSAQDIENEINNASSHPMSFVDCN